MKRKPAVPVSPDPVIEVAPIAAAELERPRAMARCEVCGSEATPNASEQLCWVCRRLKISAWRDVEQQAPAQE